MHKHKFFTYIILLSSMKKSNEKKKFLLCVLYHTNLFVCNFSYLNLFEPLVAFLSFETEGKIYENIFHTFFVPVTS